VAHNAVPVRNLAAYNQSLVQVVLVALPLLLGALLPGANLGTWLNFAVATVGAAGVYFAHTHWLKIGAAVLFAALQMALSASTDGAISHAEWNAIILAGVSVVGGLVFPNQPAPADDGGVTDDEITDQPYADH
jgi:hypothetical protein